MVVMWEPKLNNIGIHILSYLLVSGMVPDQGIIMIKVIN